jgi:hypothetical protein
VDSKARAVNRAGLLLLALAFPAAAQVVAGSYVGNGTSGRGVATRITPKWVWVKKENNGNATRTVVRTATMNGTLSKSINSSLLSGVLDAGILAIETGGFRVGDIPEVNSAGELYWFVAGIESPSAAVGSYTGDGQSGRLVPTPGLSPDWVLVLAESDATPTFAVDAPDAGLNHLFHGASVPAPTAFTAIGAGGFKVGAAAESNEPGTTYHFIAVEKTAGQSSIGTYLGNGANQRHVGPMGLFPQWAFVVAPQTNAVQGFAGRSTGGELAVADPSIGSSAGIFPVQGGIDIDGGSGRINGNNVEFVYVALGGATLLADGGVLGDPSVLLAGAVASPRHLQVGCACGTTSPLIGLPFLLLLWGRGRRRS